MTYPTSNNAAKYAYYNRQGIGVRNNVPSVRGGARIERDRRVGGLVQAPVVRGQRPGRTAECVVVERSAASVGAADARKGRSARGSKKENNKNNVGKHMPVVNVSGWLFFSCVKQLWDWGDAQTHTQEEANGTWWWVRSRSWR